jgi:uncharacterized membrane protein
MIRKASAVCNATLKSGKGTASTESGVLSQTPYLFQSRFEFGSGTNPEELLAAAISIVPAVATGLLARQLLYGGKALRGNLRLHLTLGLVSTTLIWLVCWLHYRDRHKLPQDVPVYRLAIELVAVAVVGLTGHVGGILSGVNVPGS